MKKIYMFALIAIGIAMGACNEEIVDEQFLLPDDIVEMESWIEEQNGEFSDDEFIKALTTGVLEIIEFDYYKDGEYACPGQIDGGVDPFPALIFNEDGTCLLCYGKHGYLIPDDKWVYNGFIKGEWTYDESTRTLTYLWNDISAGPNTLSRSYEVVYFKDNIVIVDWKTRIADSTPRCRMKLDGTDREEALATYVNDINAIRAEDK